MQLDDLRCVSLASEIETLRDHILQIKEASDEQSRKDKEVISVVKCTLEDHLREQEAIYDAVLVPSGFSDDDDPIPHLRRVQRVGELIVETLREGRSLLSMFLPDKAESDRVGLERLPGLLREASDKYDDMLKSAARGGAKTAMGLMMAHRPDTKIWRVTEGMPETYKNGKPINRSEVLEFVAGYATRVAGMVNTRVYFKEHAIPSNPDGDSSDDEDSAVGKDDETGDNRHEDGDGDNQMSSENLQDAGSESAGDDTI